VAEEPDARETRNPLPAPPEGRDDEWIGSVVEPPRRFEPRLLHPDDLDRGDEPSGAHLPEGELVARLPRRMRRAPVPRMFRGGREVRPLTMFPPDDRLLYNDWRYPWGLVCAIESGDAGGSGVLVGPRHVLTASHVLDWNALWATVRVHAFGSGERARSEATSVYAFTKVSGDGVPSDQVDEDYAVVVLDTPLGDRFGWMGVRTYDSSWDDDPYWSTMGYPDDVSRQYQPVAQLRFSIDEDEFDYGSGRAMETKADLLPGHSGGPVFGWWDDGPYAVAVVSSEEPDYNYCSGGSDLTRVVNVARADSP
jgi:V8-like Glu-specific endopeptidase